MAISQVLEEGPGRSWSVNEDSSEASPGCFPVEIPGQEGTNTPRSKFRFCLDKLQSRRDIIIEAQAPCANSSPCYAIGHLEAEKIILSIFQLLYFDIIQEKVHSWKLYRMCSHS